MAVTKKAEKTQQALVNELKNAVAEAESLLKDVAGKTEEEAGVIQDKVNVILEKASASFNDLEQNVREHGREAIQKTESYVQENPWQTIGLASLAGLLLGVIIGRR